MSALADLEARVRRLETSLRRTRRVASILAAGLLVTTTAAMVAQDPDVCGTNAQEVATQQEVRTERLVLMSGEFIQGVVLLAGQDGSLVIQTPEGREVLRIGGRAARLIRDD